ncbi:MAG: hypothetical protein IT384_08715 [Deltaproteobacteria bacterium]|nr:hypothetical protein [Deltaproteobacteria bacterium]
MQWALYASGARTLEAIRDHSEQEILAREWPELAGLLPSDLRFERLYYGQELCERLIPSAREVHHARRVARERGWQLSLVTYAPSDAALDGWIAVLDAIRSGGGAEDGFEDGFQHGFEDGFEIVVNDFGLLVACREHVGDAPIVLGRHMKRMLKDHRLPAATPQVEWDREEIALLKDRGVSRVELDLTPSGLPEVKDLPFPASAYLPCGCMATGRACMSGSLRLPSERKFRPAAPCGRECRAVSFDLEDPAGPRDADAAPVRLFLRGNTVFFVPSPRVLEDSLRTLGARGFDRAVLQVGPPIGG